MDSELKEAMAGLITSFVKYAVKEGDQFTLSKGELTDLLKNEMGDIFVNRGNPTVKSISDWLDLTMDGSIDFSEYMRLIVFVTELAYDMIKKIDEFSSK